MIYIVSDSHHDHSNIISYCNRPFANKDEMNEYMIEMWNRTIDPNDEVYHLGDFALCTLSQLYAFKSKLNGHIHLIKGNHDRHNNKHYLNAGFESVQKYLVLDGIMLSHYPAYIKDLNAPFKGDKSKRLWVQQLMKENGCKYIIHGHVHNLVDGNDFPKHFNASVERLNYVPRELGSIIDELMDRDLEGNHDNLV